MTDSLACTFSLSGLELTESEASLFRDANPFGYILFKRNIDTPAQVRQLTDSLRDLHGRPDLPILIDQEGGRVRRLGPPHWPGWPAAQACGSADEAATVASDMARSLGQVGITVNCAPVMDIWFEETHEAIGDRAFSDDPDDVFVKGRDVCETYLARNITPVIKHLPGQGRATLDSHTDLPVVEASLEDLRKVDFKPFQRLCSEWNFPPHPASPISSATLSPGGRGKRRDSAEGEGGYMPPFWAMISHIVYSAIDPVHPASVSSAVIETIRSEIGFDGLLLSDDVSMGALEKYGRPEDRCVKMLEAGCDIALYCAGILEDMEKIAARVPSMTSAAQDRYERSQHRSESGSGAGSGAKSGTGLSGRPAA